MKSCMRLFFISLIVPVGLIMGNCTGRNLGENHRSHTNTGSERETDGEPPSPSPYTQESNPSAKTVTLSVKGIVCQSCKNSLESLLRVEEGVSSVEVFLERQKNNVVVSYNPKKISLEQIKTIINETWEVEP